MVNDEDVGTTDESSSDFELPEEIPQNDVNIRLQMALSNPRQTVKYGTE